MSSKLETFLSDVQKKNKFKYFENLSQTTLDTPIKPVGPLFLLDSYWAVSYLVGHVGKRCLAFWKVECTLHQFQIQELYVRCL